MVRSGGLLLMHPAPASGGQRAGRGGRARAAGARGWRPGGARARAWHLCGASVRRATRGDRRSPAGGAGGARAARARIGGQAALHAQSAFAECRIGPLGRTQLMLSGLGEGGCSEGLGCLSCGPWGRSHVAAGVASGWSASLFAAPCPRQFAGCTPPPQCVSAALRRRGHLGRRAPPPPLARRTCVCATARPPQGTPSLVVLSPVGVVPLPPPGWHLPQLGRCRAVAGPLPMLHRSWAQCGKHLGPTRAESGRHRHDWTDLG